MGKKLKDLKWESVGLKGVSAEALTQNFEGFLGLEECIDYGLDLKDSKTSKKKKQPKNKKRKNTEAENETKPTIVPAKKVRLSNGFTVEPCQVSKPSQTNEDIMATKKQKPSKTNEDILKIKKEQPLKTKEKPKKKQKAKLGETVQESSLSLEDMQSWSQFQIPDEILKALAEQGFRRPTRIQELTLPTAMLGRRDILGAAETGSGKTLAFGIPILSGIMKLKEQAKQGIDVYEAQYKKSSVKKKDLVVEEKKKNVKQKTGKKQKVKKQESSEEGYSSDSGNDDDHANGDDEFIEEYDVPMRKKSSVDENDSDYDDDKYVHLSEMVDSDDFAETDESDNDSDGGDPIDDGDDSGDDQNDGSDDDSAKGDDEDTDDQEEFDEDNQGIGCVKVIDDIKLPGHEVVRTGKPLYGLILTPTRELAIQISRHLISAAKYTGIRIATIVGGMAAVKQERVLSRGPELVVATPGRLWALLKEGQPHLQQVDNIKFLAIDETDRMVERNHFEELHPLLERINSDEAQRTSRQNFVFSATLTMVHDLPAHMKGKKVTKRGKIINRKITKMTPQQKVKKLVDLIGMSDPKVVDITSQNLGTAETLTECRIICSLEEKDYYLHYILKRHPGRTIVFCNSIGSVKRLAQLFSLLDCHPLPLHASMPQRQRLKNLERFRDDPCGVLVATDVAARGLDIPDVDHVLHYQVPRTAENYVHRSGRTARANKEGLTILMMEPGEAALYSKLCRTLNKQNELPTFPVPSHILSALRATVSLAREVDRLALQRRRAAAESGWLDKAARDMDMLVDEDFVQVKHRETKSDKVFLAKKRQLQAMLAKPLFPKGFSYKYPTLNTNAINADMKTDNALQVMKKAIETGELKKAKRTSKNAPLLKLGKTLKSNSNK